jgi:ATP-dependent Clp protease ATP-binding subunit ClpC
VLLLDEIEKAHPDVFNILLQILEDDRLTDAQGRTVDFRNAIVIMTSNIGAAAIAKNTGVGFTIGDETGLNYEDMKTGIMGELKKVFRPEFLNRIDEVIVFHKLEKAQIRQIVELLLKRVRESLAERELSLNLSEDATDLLVEKGWDPSMGARPLRRAIQRYIEDPISDELLRTGMEPGSNVEIDRSSETDEDGEPEVKISITTPVRKKEAVGVGAEGAPSGEDDDSSAGDDDGEPKGSAELPDDPDVLPDVPDAPPPEDSGEGAGDDDSK